MRQSRTNSARESLRVAGETPFFSQAIELLRATGICQWAKHAGEQAPAATLTGLRGDAISLSDLWREGPLVVVFYRGNWCGTCLGQLRAWEAETGALSRLGASVVAISPEPAGHQLETARTLTLTYPVLSDPRMDAAIGFHVALSLPPETVDMYAHLGVDAPVLDAQGQWAFPIPATFLVDRGGRIQFSHVDLDVSRRIQPAEVMPFVRALQGSRPAE